jgi:hypothetical protein
MNQESAVTPRDIVGYLLLFLGVIVIVLALQNGYQLFRGEIEPVKLFDLPGISLDLTKSFSESLSSDLTKGVPTSSPQEIVSKEAVTAPLNFFAHLALLGLFVSIGGKIASIGVDLTRPYIIRPQASKMESKLQEVK